MTIPKPDLDPSRPRRLVLAASTGGHLAQLVRLAPGLGASEDSLWVTHKSPQSESLLANRDVMYVPYLGPRDAAGVMRAFLSIRGRLREERYDAAVSTGAALALAALPAARAERLPSLYIESVSRVDGPSLSGRVLATTGLAEVRTQHPNWSGGRWGTHPTVLSTFSSTPGTRVPARQLNVFVTLGTHERFRFDALVDRLLSLGIAGPRSVWQLGCTPPRAGMPGRVHDTLPAADFERAAREADVVITHAGVGTILGLLDMGVYPVAVVRRKARGEHVDDHQSQIAHLIRELGIGAGLELEELDDTVLREAAGRVVRPFEPTPAPTTLPPPAPTPVDDRQIFVPGVGQYENIGDVILRRELISWLRPLGRLHVYVGPSPAGYAESLSLGPDAVVYRSFASYYRALLANAWARRADYLFKPGEIQLTLVGMKEHLSMLPLLAILRARGGRVARIGSGARNFARLPRLLITPSVLLSQLTAWRDARTASYLKRGDLMPDLAFAGGSTEAEIDRHVERDVVVVSMRGDRPEPTDAWVAGVSAYSRDRGQRLVVVTQVLSDRERSRRLAERLQADLVDWDGSDHAAQEARIRAVYRRASLVVSDRLHVLIGAVTEGALPLALLVDGSDKVARNFEAAGMEQVARSSQGMSVADVMAALSTAETLRSSRRAELAEARHALNAVRARLETLLARSPRVAMRSVS